MFVEKLMHAIDKGAGSQRCGEQRHCVAFGNLQKVERRRQARRDDDAGHVGAEETVEGVALIVGLKTAQILHFGIAKYLHAATANGLNQSGNCQARFLNTEVLDIAVEARAAGYEF